MRWPEHERGSENWLTLMALPDRTAETYAYAADGLRRTLVTMTFTTQFVWDGQNVLLDTDGSGNTQAHYTDSSGYWGGLVSQRRGSASSFFVFDPSANARALTDGQGAVTDAYVSTAFGEEKG
ncbi:MAG: hypothetical protein JO250_20655 [Armatimonadetes bacterium]|nr:hypothetical protein [Armatimonadota bacterium]